MVIPIQEHIIAMDTTPLLLIGHIAQGNLCIVAQLVIAKFKIMTSTDFQMGQSMKQS
jgi:hypothetical protein